MTTTPERIAGDAAFAARRARYDRARRLYSDDLIDYHQQHRRPTPPRNYARLIVDTITSYMGTPIVNWQHQTTPALERLLAAVEQHEQLPARDVAWELGCAIDGDAAWKVTLQPSATRPRIAVVAVDPSTIWADVDPAEPTSPPLRVVQQYRLRADSARDRYNLRPTTADDRYVRISEEWTPTAVRMYIDNELQRDEPNPYGVIPYVLAPNVQQPHTLWGTSDILPLERHQLALTAAEADADWVMAMAGSVVIFEGVDEPPGGPTLPIAPGSTWTLPEGARATILDLLSSGHMDQRLRYIEHLRASLFELARVPAAATAATELRQNVSGIAIQLQLSPILKLVARKRVARSAAYAQRAALIARLAALAGLLEEEPPQEPPAVTWQDATPVDQRETLAAAAAELAIGADPARILRSLGVEDPAAELAANARWQRERRPEPTPERDGSTN